MPDDELTARLRAAARKPRPWTATSIGVLLALFLIPAALFVWWIFPRPELPPLEVVAFDRLGLPRAEVTLRARLEPIGNIDEPPNLTGLTVHFEDELLPLQAAKDRKQIGAVSDREGNVSTTWTFPVDGPVHAYLVRQVGDRVRSGKSDRAQVFSWPAATPLLVVDVQESLAAADAETWRTRNILDITPITGAGKALQAARSRKYEIVYLATEPESALVYRKMRGWVANQKAGRESFPAGPVLGRPSFDQEAAQAREALLRELTQQFTGSIVTVMAASESAATSRALGLTTIVIGEAAAPLEIMRVKSWSEVPGKLPGAPR